MVLKKIISFFVIAILMFSVFPVLVIAPSHPDDIGGEKLTGTTVTFGDPGTTMPGDFFHPFEVWFEDLTGVSEEKQIEERYAEANKLIQDGNYANVEIALDEAADSHEALQTELETLAETTVETTAKETTSTEANLQQENSILHNAIEEVVETEQTLQTLDNQLDAIHTELIADVEAGTLTEETAGDIFNEVQEASAETEVTLVKETKQVVETISTETGVSDYEAELVFNSVQDDAGLHEEFKEDVNHEAFVALETAIVEITEEIQTLESAGENTVAA